MAGLSLKAEYIVVRVLEVIRIHGLFLSIEMWCTVVKRVSAKIQKIAVVR